MRRNVPIGLPKEPVALAPKYWGSAWDVILGAVGGGSSYTEEGGMAVVCVEGELSRAGSWLDGDSGYKAILDRFKKALDSDKDTVAIRYHSPGGEFQGCVELGVAMARAAKVAGKKYIAYTDSKCLSAAYALAAGADEIYLSPSAMVGSVGVWAPLVDQTALDKMMGLNVAIVASGDRKLDGNPHIPISPAAYNSLQEKVSDMAGMFFRHVGAARGLTEDQVSALQGDEFMGVRAVEAGLADKVMTWSDLVAKFGKSEKPSGGKQERTIPMGKHARALAALRAMAEKGTEEEKEETMKSMKALEEDEKEEKKEMKASDMKEEEKKEDADGKKGKKAKADSKEDACNAAALDFDAVQRLHALESRINAKDEQEQITALLASRPDFGKEVLGFLAGKPLAVVKDAVEKLPKPTGRFAAASQTFPGVVGGGQKDEMTFTPMSLDAELDRVFSRNTPAKFGVGNFDVEAARAHLAAASKGGK